MITKDQATKFLGLVGELSPENLCCDGELPIRAVRARRRDIMKRWAALEKSLNVKATETDVFKALGWI